MQHHPHLRAFYEHPPAKGKLTMQALLAVMRKLSPGIYGMIKHHQACERPKVYRLPERFGVAPSTRARREAA